MAKQKQCPPPSPIPMSDILPEFKKVASAWNGFGTSYQIWDSVKLASDFQNAAIKELKKLNQNYGKNKIKR